ncbi:hypothetical protein TSUD_285870 [Trifolium subterraneum]|uniref:Uncharacterized protein n=1 Tax=Trifolium subterraneum TaxID=3900 RepID=A0A2Z6PC75_TRISU|nr:hypothetical protein TSUD_285870 [Trifolium subterraneum]
MKEESEASAQKEAKAEMSRVNFRLNYSLNLHVTSMSLHLDAFSIVSSLRLPSSVLPVNCTAVLSAMYFADFA